jgi:GNAT superfamily N-acetyltransferase
LSAAAALTVREIDRADYDGWRPLWDGYNTFYGRSGPTALDPAITAVTWDRFFDANEPVHALVAERDGRIVGLVHYLYHRTTTMIAPTCYLNDLFTLPEARGGGVGEALIEAVYVRARAAGSSRVYWSTHETNATAQRLYDRVAKKSGFIIYRQEV